MKTELSPKQKKSIKRINHWLVRLINLAFLLWLGSIWVPNYRLKMIATGVWCFVVAILLTIGLKELEKEHKDEKKVK